MKKKKALLLLTALTPTLAVFTTLAVMNKNGINAFAFNRSITPGNYTLTLNSGHKLLTATEEDRLSDKYINTNLGNRVYFDYGADLALNPGVVDDTINNGVVDLGDDRTIYNVNAIYGMTSITVNYTFDDDSDDQKFYLAFGYKDDEGTIVYSNKTRYISGALYSFDQAHPSYFLLQAYDAATITSIEITYTCEEESFIPTFNDYLTFTTLNDEECRIDGYARDTEREYAHAFDSCSFELVIPSTYNGRTVVEIKEKAFDIEDLTTVIIPEGVRVINKWAFMGNIELRRLILPSTIESVADDAFQLCINLTTMHVTASMTNLTPASFNSNPFVENITVDSSNPNYYAVDGVLYARDYSDDFLSHRTAIVACPIAKTGTITIPNDIEYIPNGSFKKSNATTIHIGSGVKYIEERFDTAKTVTNFEVESNNKDFSAVSGLLCDINGAVLVAYPRGRTGDENKSFIMPNGITRVLDNVFNDVDIIETLNLNEVAYIGDNAFANMDNLQTVLFPNATSLGDGAFKNDKHLTDVTLPITLSEIPTECFMGCIAMTGISLPSKLQVMGARAFKGCTSLASLALPYERFTTLGSEAFMNCTSLAIDLDIPDSVTSCGSGVFRNTPITSFEISYGLSAIPSYLFANCDSLTYITIDPNIISIGEGAFEGCDNIYRIDLSDNLETISYRAFKGCAVHYQFIPSSVTTIYGGAFDFSTSDAQYYSPNKNMPSTWMEYWSGHTMQYTSLNPGLENGCSRSKFNELAETYNFWGNH